ncbi:MAG TPA: hypothetical protein VKH44_05370, partial [Pirellulaceae bacterium]|nr:hypothetical protein [Pirellulaceae bacterium]
MNPRASLPAKLADDGCTERAAADQATAMRRLFICIASVLVLAAFFAGIFWVRQQQIATRRLEAWQAQREEDAIPPVFSHEFDWERAEVTLAEFADLLAAKSRLPVELDEGGIAANGRWKTKPSDIKVHVPRGNFPLPLLAQMVLVQQGLCTDLRDQKLVITTLENSTERKRLRTVVYPLPQPEPRGLNETDWAQILDANIHGHVEAVPGAIIVVANAIEQRRTRLVIDTICGLRDNTPGRVVIPPAPLGAAEKRVLAALDAPASIDAVEMPLKDVVLYLVESHGVPLVLAADKLAEASVGIDTPITKSLQGISLRSLLALVLKDLELTFFARDGALLITTPEDAESRLRTVAYPVHDLAGGDGAGDPDSIMKLMTSCLDPGMWRTYGGPGLIHRVEDGWLVIEQTEEIHERVAAFLAVLRRMLAAPGRLGGQSIAPADEAGRRIREALDRPVELDFDNVPLKDAVKHLRKSLKIPIVLSLKKLEEASVSPDTPVTQKLAAGPAARQLETLLKELELDFVIRDEVLQITTPEDVESQLVTRIYDTRS